MELFENERKARIKGGHAAAPGSGPEGKTCGMCKNIITKYFAKKYFKCGLMRRCWTNGPGTDIRKRDTACRYFENREIQEAKG
jgi:hypothetical protein